MSLVVAVFSQRIRVIQGCNLLLSFCLKPSIIDAGNVWLFSQMTISLSIFSYTKKNVVSISTTQVSCTIKDWNTAQDAVNGRFQGSIAIEPEVNLEEVFGHTF